MSTANPYNLPPPTNGLPYLRLMSGNEDIFYNALTRTRQVAVVFERSCGHTHVFFRYIKTGDCLGRACDPRFWRRYRREHAAFPITEISLVHCRPDAIRLLFVFIMGYTDLPALRRVQLVDSRKTGLRLPGCIDKLLEAIGRSNNCSVTCRTEAPSEQMHFA